ncbi:M23 family metallopeptidase [Sphingomonas xanthus]|uniref:M23 family metallopeptidase n=1 Tax=Sphingomonas xanthus TaxID=2594473 RepID=A0A516ISJ8_9SPHN|nr:M23 family metallopeptidase [Sphingomonas xanthus]QDP19839.1 M23 family metallopeptidase [Sphingomonas xanthus]
MTQTTIAAARLFRTRDLFFHDGNHLRRLRLSAPVQLVMLSLMALVLAWSAYSTVRLFTVQPVVVSAAAPSTDIARLAAATEAKVRELEHRQQILAAMLAGEDVKPEAIAELGYALAPAGAKGGPFEASSQADPTFKSLFTSWKKLDNLADGAIAVPSDKPVKTAEFTSGYGIRSDPFRGGAAKHAGIDLAAPIGTPIYATADGVVREAAYNSGGYGNLIKIEHGRGIETRYAHLSSMTVRQGQRVSRGQLIGRMGSTGRSTGSHLHYEVRIDGRAVNPIPFMKSNEYLLAMQKNGAGVHAMDAVALGGPTGGKR